MASNESLSWDQKPLNKWSCEDVERFFEKYEGGRFKTEERHFKLINGNDICKFSKEEFLQFASTPAIGTALYNIFAEFKPQDTSGPSALAQSNESPLTMSKLRAELSRIWATGSTTSGSTFTLRYKNRIVTQSIPWFEKNTSIDFTFPIAPRNSLEPVVQDLWSEDILPSLKKLSLPIQLVDSHTTPSIGTRKPDLPGYLSQVLNCIFYLAIVGELKKSRRTSNEFTNEEKGELDSFLEDLLLHQPYRSVATGFLCDGIIIQFFQLSKVNNSLHLKESVVYPLDGAGGQFLLGLLSTSSEQLGLSIESIMVEKEPVKVEALLGHGASALVYQGKWKDKTVVVKTFRPGMLSVLRSEQENLQNLNNLVPRIPTFLATNEEVGILLTEPVANHFPVTLVDYLYSGDEPVKLQHFKDLLNLLEVIHKNNYVHRDIKLSNFFPNPTLRGQILLNDWSSATTIGEPTSFSGSMQHASTRILLFLEAGVDEAYLPKASDDLESFVKCVFEFQSPQKFKEISQTAKPSELLKWWEKIYQAQFWGTFQKAAVDSNYKKMEETLTSLVWI